MIIYREDTKKAMGGWIKVTPETMPQDMQSVMVTVKHPGGGSGVYPEARFNGNAGKWQWAYVPAYDDWVDFENEVTHWMPWPTPPDD